jgi:hypothetical protein
VARTTLDIDASVLRELKKRQRRENKTLGRLASELLARALADERVDDALRPLHWTSKDLGLKVDLEDKEAIWSALDAG